jgi:hypothetical protein
MHKVSLPIHKKGSCSQNEPTSSTNGIEKIHGNGYPDLSAYFRIVKFTFAETAEAVGSRGYGDLHRRRPSPILRRN